MKNYARYITIIVFGLLTTGALAQGPPGQERIRTLKVGFLTERLALTATEAQKFWPVYNAHDEVIQKLRRKERQRFGSQLPFIDDLSNDEAMKLLTEFSALKDEKHKVEQQFLRDLQNVLPAKKIILLLKAEEDFKRRLLQQVRKRKGPQR